MFMAVALAAGSSEGTSRACRSKFEKHLLLVAVVDVQTGEDVE